jgi:diguanylate cyclase (GGDEF)-like protein
MEQAGIPIWLYGAVIVVIVVAGFVGGAAATALRVYDQHLAGAHDELRASARRSAASLTRSLDSTAAYAKTLGRDFHLERGIDDPQACAGALEPLSGLAVGAYLALYNPSGAVVCSAPSGARLPVAAHDVLRPAIAAARPAVEIVPARGHEYGIGLVSPLPRRSGSAPGTLVALMPLSSFLDTLADPLSDTGRLGQSARFVVATAAGDIVATNEQRTRGSGNVFGGRLAGTWVGLDGVARVYEGADVAAYGLRTFAGIPDSQLRARAREVVGGLVPVAAAVLAGVLGLTLLLTSKVTGTIRRITASVDHSGIRVDPEPVPVEGARELRRLARAYNAMLEDRLEYERQLEQQALHDGLTGLANRTLIVDRLEQALARARRDGRSVGVLFCDLDRFKIVNDSLGHDRGDQILVAAADRITRAVRPGDTVARFGGDEFVVLCEGIAYADDAEAVAQRLRAALAYPLEIEGLDLAVGLSVGIAISDGTSCADDLLRDADTAMYAVKARGGGGVETFHPELHERAQDRWEIERDLRRALDREGLTVWYQPQVDVETGDVVGVEALLRWPHPTRGFIPPLSFLPVAEETGLMGRIGEFVLRRACTQAVAWQREGFAPTMAVNISPRQLGPDLEDLVGRVLLETGLDAAQLCLEFTENDLVDTGPENTAILRRLRQRGVRIALDDFGIGYSSLSALRSLPVDTLKIDRSLLVDLEDRDNVAITTAVVELAAALGLTAVAEGVEHDDQMAVLHEIGCHLVQGFLFARPEPPERLIRRARPLRRAATPDAPPGV